MEEGNVGGYLMKWLYKKLGYGLSISYLIHEKENEEAQSIARQSTNCKETKKNEFDL